MTKKKAEKPQREVTKRQLSRWQQQKKRERIILSSGIFIIVAVLGIVGAGWYISHYQPLHQTVIRVNDVEFDMNYYVKMLSYYGKGQPSQYMPFVADEVTTIIEQNELIRQGATELGISVSDDEVDEELNKRDPPLSKDYRDVVRTQMLVSKLRDEYFDQKVPLFAEQRHIMAMFLESESQVIEVSAGLEDSESFNELASELSLESYSKEKKGDLGWHPEGILTALLATSIPDEYAFSHEAGMLSQPISDDSKIKPVGYWLIRVLEREAEAAEVEAILLGSEQEAQGVRASLEAGGDFAALAKELSQDDASKAKGGYLDRLTPGTMGSAFDEFIFDSEVELNTLSQPIRDDTVITIGGYWLVKVLDKEDNKKIEDDDRDFLKGKALNEWVTALWDDPENSVESYLDEEKMAWAVERVVGS